MEQGDLCYDHEVIKRDEEDDDKWEIEGMGIVTREEKNTDKPSIAAKRGLYKKALKRSSATDDIDSIQSNKGSTASENA